MRLQVDAAPPRRRPRRTGARFPRAHRSSCVMHLDDLDVELFAERLRHLPVVSTASRLTPRLMLPDLTIAVFFAASATLASSAADMPVVPMMCASCVSAASAASRTVAAGIVKSGCRRRQASAAAPRWSPPRGSAAGRRGRRNPGPAAAIPRPRLRPRARGRRLGNRLHQRAPMRPPAPGHDQPHVWHCFSPAVRGAGIAAGGAVVSRAARRHSPR